jgi:hypothetical protein
MKLRYLKFQSSKHQALLSVFRKADMRSRRRKMKQQQLLWKGTRKVLPVILKRKDEQT